MSDHKHIVLLGPPGGGKGTFSSQITGILPNIVHVSTGDIFRANLKNETPLGLKAKEYMDKGELVPDEITNNMIKTRLEEISEESWILDGYPRNLKQAEFLSKITDVNLVIALSVDDSIIVKRILGRYSCKNCGEIYNKYFMKPKKEGICDKCGASIKFEQRADDNEETLKNRLNIYRENSKPLIEFYSEQGIIKNVNYENKLKEKKIKKLLNL